jgi:hypothetical protein
MPSNKISVSLKGIYVQRVVAYNIKVHSEIQAKITGNFH